MSRIDGNRSTPRRNGNGAAPAAPRRVRNGIRLRNRDAATASNWIAERWLALVESAAGGDEREKGFAYARSGQTVALEIECGMVRGRVQGTAPQAYETRIHVAPFGESDWQRVIDAMAGEALYAAALLSREVPRSMDELFAALELRFLASEPTVAESPPAVRFECTCNAQAPCKHALALAYLLAERFSEEATAIFDLYGMPADRVQERLRQARSMHTRGVAAAHADPFITESQVEPPPLEECLEDFWRCGPRLAELEVAPPPQHVKHALLRRLGPPPLGGRFPLVGLLASIYDAVADAAVRIRDQAEHIQDPLCGPPDGDSP
jgi:uncharacterized Zn finger protein